MTNNYIIYEIVCNDTNIKEIYIGSTKAYRQRKSFHKKHSDNIYNTNTDIYNLKVYQIIRANGGWENFTMRPLEEIVCNSKIQALIREQYWIDLKQSTMNTKIAYLTEEQKNNYNTEYYKSNKTHICNKQKDYYKNNKDHIKEYQNENKEIIEEQHKLWLQANKERVKETKKLWREKNKEKIKEQMKVWRENNKEHVKEYQTQYNLERKKININEDD